MKAFSWFDSVGVRYTIIAETEIAARGFALDQFNRPNDPSCRAMAIFSKPARLVHKQPTIIVSDGRWPIYEV